MDHFVHWKLAHLRECLDELKQLKVNDGLSRAAGERYLHLALLAVFAICERGGVSVQNYQVSEGFLDPILAGCAGYFKNPSVYQPLAVWKDRLGSGEPFSLEAALEDLDLLEQCYLEIRGQ